LHPKYNLYDALDLTKLLRVQVIGHLDVLVFRPRDLEEEACRCELNELQAEVACVGIMITLPGTAEGQFRPGAGMPRAFQGTR
jgi:hypothetical protein